MKLREQIKLCVDNDQLEKIADDFAIGFAEWYFIETFISDNSVELTTKQLLEIYKQEKGL